MLCDTVLRSMIPAWLVAWSHSNPGYQFVCYTSSTLCRGHVKAPYWILLNAPEVEARRAWCPRNVAIHWRFSSIVNSSTWNCKFIFQCDKGIIYIVYIHIQIPLTGYAGLIQRSTAVATVSHSTSEGTMRVLIHYCDKRLRSYCTRSCCRVPS